MSINAMRGQARITSPNDVGAAAFRGASALGRIVCFDAGLCYHSLLSWSQLSKLKT